LDWATIKQKAEILTLSILLNKSDLSLTMRKLSRRFNREKLFPRFLSKNKSTWKSLELSHHKILISLFKMRAKSMKLHLNLRTSNSQSNDISNRFHVRPSPANSWKTNSPSSRLNWQDSNKNWQRTLLKVWLTSLCWTKWTNLTEPQNQFPKICTQSKSSTCPSLDLSRNSGQTRLCGLLQPNLENAKTQSVPPTLLSNPDISKRRRQTRLKNSKASKWLTNWDWKTKKNRSRDLKPC